MTNLAVMWRKLGGGGSKEAKPEAGSPAGYCHNPAEVAVVGQQQSWQEVVRFGLYFESKADSIC